MDNPFVAEALARQAGGMTIDFAAKRPPADAHPRRFLVANAIT